MLKALAPLDYVLVMEVTQEQTGHDPAAGFGANGKPDFWIGGEGGLNKPLHVAIRREGSRHRRCVLQGSHGGRRTRQRRARNPRALSSELLRRIRARSRWPQHRGGLPRAGDDSDRIPDRGTSPASVAVIVDADRTARNSAGDAGHANRAAARRSAGQSAPEVPPPMREPGEPPLPQELPGKMPDELPVRGPNGPLDAKSADRLAGTLTGDNVRLDLKPSPECAMNNRACNPLRRRNKKRPRFPARHNPA